MKSKEFKTSLKDIHSIFVDSITLLDEELQKQTKKIKQEHLEVVINEKIKLLYEICLGENLDFNLIKNKYLKSKEISMISLEEIPKEKQVVEEEVVLNKIIFNEMEYYYETFGNNIVYNMESKPVGIYKNNKIIFD
jgi:hypothetical protein